MSAGTRKSMRVATVFTGVAACAAIAAPVAHASSGHRRTGSIREVDNCSAQLHNWLHVRSKGNSHQSPTIRCYGFRGKYSPSGEIGILSECGGNNFGYLSAKGAGAWNFSFDPGTYYRPLNHSHLAAVYIGGWAGGDACP